MNVKIKKWVRGALAVVAATGVIFLVAPIFMGSPAEPNGVSATPTVMAGGGNGNPQVQAAPTNAWFDAAPSGNTAAMVSPLSTMSPPLFVGDSRGRLLLNADTHANIEKLLLEQDPAAMQANLEQASKNLPPQARAELKVLVAQFQQYAKALPHTIPPDTAPETEQEQLKLLDRLHGLRVSYLGEDAARAMFGEEEATTRKLLSLIAAQDDPNLTPQQKADRAQDALSKQSQPKPPPAS